MKLKTPTITQFNAWSSSEREWWIDYYTAGVYKAVDCTNGFPVIFYHKEDVAIVYTVDKKADYWNQQR